jgi:hypothetical protein
MRIEDSKIRGPKHLDHVDDIGDKGIGHTGTQWKGLKSLHRPRVMLGEVGDDAEEHGQGKERDLLCKERTNQRPSEGCRLNRDVYRRCCAFFTLG